MEQEIDRRIWSDIGRDVDAKAVYCGEERAELKGKTLNLGQSTSQLEPMVRSSDK